MDNRLDDHGASVYERENHEERKQLRYGYEKSVENVARRGELLHVDSGQLLPVCVMGHNSSLYHVLQVDEARSKVSHIDTGVDSRYWGAEHVSYPFRRIYFVTVHSERRK